MGDGDGRRENGARAVPRPACGSTFAAASRALPPPPVSSSAHRLPNGGARRAGACGFQGRAAQLVGEFLGQSGAGDGARDEPRRRAIRLRAPGLRQRPGERARELRLRRRDHPARRRDRRRAAYAAHRRAARRASPSPSRRASPRTGVSRGSAPRTSSISSCPTASPTATRAMTTRRSPRGSSTGARGATTTAATSPACARASPTSSR